jgi:hypothetical protein
MAGTGAPDKAMKEDGGAMPDLYAQDPAVPDVTRRIGWNLADDVIGYVIQNPDPQ